MNDSDYGSRNRRTYTTRNTPGFCEKTRKTSYRTRKQALTAAARAHARLGKKLRAYKCADCRRWHLTSKVDTEGTP